MFTIFWRYFKDRKISLAIYSIASAAFVWMYVAIFPTLQDQAEEFEELFQTYPSEILEALNVEQISFDTIERFLQIEQYSLIWPLMVIIFLVALAGTALSFEVEKGTIENILAKPISRMQLFFGRYLAGAASLLAFTLISVFSVVPLAALHNIDVVIEAYIAVSVLGFLFGLAIFSVAFMFSAMFSEKSKAAIFSGSIMLVMYVLNLLSNLVDKLENLKYFSFFYYYDFNAAMADFEVATVNIFFFVCVSVVCTAIGAFWYQRRDIAV